MDTKNYKILIVDDSEKNLKLFKLIIASMGYETITAGNGEEGIKKAKEQSPDLVLMDIQMPVMDGVSAVNVLSADESTKNIPIIALTSYAMKGDRERFLQHGFTDYISKPIDTDNFMDTIKRVLGESYG